MQLVYYNIKKVASNSIISEKYIVTYYRDYAVNTLISYRIFLFFHVFILNFHLITLIIYARPENNIDHWWFELQYPELHTYYL